MTLLHVYFSLRNQQAFQRLLERDRSATGQHGAPSTSGGKSWSRKNLTSAIEVNAFDDLGRTVLHLACSSPEPSSLEYTRMLLAHPSINVNLVDKENHWTALHRALYAGNLEAAIMLLKRTETDTSIKDMEGYTAFDLFNSTVQSANPTSLEDGYADLLTWGTNRNAALGLGDSNDRLHPDHVVLTRKDAPLPSSRTLEERFRPVKVREVCMSKLHTVILTDESRENVRLCGFGSGGRLGPFSHTLYTPTSLPLSSHTIVAVALGQDHTLALTIAGEVVSWGLNRFAQLGYIVEAGQGGSADESIQTTPRKIGHLKKEFVKGIAACKTASACWSDTDVWTWGMNGGQLGYDKTASPIQVLPRKVSVITQPVHGIAMSESAMVCLFVNGEVACIWNGGVSKINFPAHAFPSDISTVYRPPQTVRGTPITKLVNCDDTFAALSSSGEVFTFSAPAPTELEGSTAGASTGGNRGQIIKPQRAWALRRQFSNVRDVDIGGDGALIVCTQSGHVFVRCRNLKAGTMGGGVKAFKFQRVAHVQRAVAVCANSTGAFGALRVDFKPPPISITGKQFSGDIATIAPYYLSEGASFAGQALNIPLDVLINADDDLKDSSILDDIGEVAKLISVLRSRLTRPGVFTAKDIKHGADITVRIGTKFEVPAHLAVLVARCIPLQALFSNGAVLEDKPSNISATFVQQTSSGSLASSPILHFTGISPLALLTLLHYLYADEVLAIWDLRIGSLFDAQFSSLGVQPAQVKMDLAGLSRLLDLHHLALALQSVGKRAPKPSASDDFRRLFDQTQGFGSLRRSVREHPLAPDVALHLADKTVYVHSAILRARSAFFAAFFDDPDWTARRKDDSGVVDIEMRHHKWQVMEFVLQFICFGEEKMFETLELLDTVDGVLEFMFLVISAANELLLTRLVLLCSQVVLKFLNVYNACYLLTDAIHYNAVDLADRIKSYMTANTELLLESRILDVLDPRVVRKLSEYTCAEQAAESPITRLDKLGRAALEKHKDWLALQDIPMPFVPSQKPQVLRESPPSSAKKAGRQLRLYSPTASPTLRPSLAAPLPMLRSKLSGDDIFAMDDTEIVPPLKLSSTQQPWTIVSGSDDVLVPVSARAGWKKNPATPRTDLKAIIAEAETSKKPTNAYRARRSLETAPLTPSPGAGQSAGSGAGPTATVGQSEGLSRQAGPGSGLGPGLSPQWRAENPPTPRRVPSDLAIPQQTPTPSRTITVASPVSSTKVGASPGRPMMGLVITPVRQTPSSSGSGGTGPGVGGSRKPSLGGAWTLPPVQPIAAPTVPSSANLSFAEIQRMQELQGTAPAPTDKRSLREIQEEERARQQEADFLKWWAAEEERVRLEAPPQAQVGGQLRSQAGGARSGGGGHGSNKDGKGRLRKPKAEAQPEGTPSSSGHQQRESRTPRRRRPREDNETHAKYEE